MIRGSVLIKKVLKVKGKGQVGEWNKSILNIVSKGKLIQELCWLEFRNCDTMGKDQN